ncbi:sulfate permease [Vibrio maritimus]|uniref:Sulfate permease n=1 Tax=Vibrio maritimus TaxID=990268 RepID=A0A090TBD4_9VIBR|nr:sulfate permease [Vibrio maritimus]
MEPSVHSQDQQNTQDQQIAKYSVGIDLGTTHCVMSFIDTQNEDAQVEVVSIPQLTAPGTVESYKQLGSFCISHTNMRWVKALALFLGRVNRKRLWVLSLVI